LRQVLREAVVFADQDATSFNADHRQAYIRCIGRTIAATAWYLGVDAYAIDALINGAWIAIIAIDGRVDAALYWIAAINGAGIFVITIQGSAGQAA